MQYWIEITTKNQIQDIIEIVPINNIIHMSKYGGTDPKILLNLKNQDQVFCNKQNTITVHDSFANEHHQIDFDDVINWILSKQK